jgi:hypothetical protein
MDSEAYKQDDLMIHKKTGILGFISRVSDGFVGIIYLDEVDSKSCRPLWDKENFNKQWRILG